MDPELTKLLVGVVAPAVTTVGLIVVALVNSRRAPRTREPDSEDEVPAKATASPLDQQRANIAAESVTLEAFREFRTWAERRIEEQDDRIDRLQNALARMSQKYTLIKEAFREFVVATRRRLGNETPRLEAHVRELLVEDDLDGTLDVEFVREIQRDPPPPPV